MRSKQNLYLTLKRDRVVVEGDTDAAFLLIGKGGYRDDSVLKREHGNAIFEQARALNKDEEKPEPKPEPVEEKATEEAPEDKQVVGPPANKSRSTPSKKV